MSEQKKIILIAAWPAVAVIVILHNRAVMSGLSFEAQEIIQASHKWLATVIALYALSFALAWRWSHVWALSLSRLLVWAVIAYLCISKSIDLIGMTPESRWQLVGMSGATDPALLAQIRAELSVWLAALAMSLTAIAVGFEKHADGPDEAAPKKKE